jgi:hypothetical protein
VRARAFTNGSTLTSLGHNLDSGTSCQFTPPADLVNTNPALGALGDNGGPTKTLALLVGSLAIDGGDPAGCTDAHGAALTTDQRGAVRPQRARCDSGAYEFQADPCMSIVSVPAAGGVFEDLTSDIGMLSASCAVTSNAPDRVFAWTPAVSGTATISTCGAGTDFDTVVYVRTGTCARHDCRVQRQRVRRNGRGLDAFSERRRRDALLGRRRRQELCAG